MPLLETLGWDSYFASQLGDADRAELVPGRVVGDRGPRLAVCFEDGERTVSVPGRLKAAALAPVVGDFVLCPRGDAPPVARVLARRTHLSRGAAGRATAEQVLAANVDLVFIVQGLDAGVSSRRLERSIAAVLGCGPEPVVVLTKPDLAVDALAALVEARGVVGSAKVLVASGRTGEGLEDLRSLVPPGRTAVFVGPSGAGKSTLVNALMQAPLQETRAVREHDRRGRHATTARQLLVLPGGGAVIDSPGIRELKLWDSGALDLVFDDVTALARSCKFADCRHRDEPGCAVLEEVRAGRLDAARVESLHKLQGEAEVLEARRTFGAARAEKQRWHGISREQRRLRRDRGDD